MAASCFGARAHLRASSFLSRTRSHHADGFLFRRWGRVRVGRERGLLLACAVSQREHEVRRLDVGVHAGRGLVRGEQQLLQRRLRHGRRGLLGGPKRACGLQRGLGRGVWGRGQLLRRSLRPLDGHVPVRPKRRLLPKQSTVLHRGLRPRQQHLLVDAEWGLGGRRRRMRPRRNVQRELHRQLRRWVHGRKLCRLQPRARLVQQRLLRHVRQSVYGRPMPRKLPSLARLRNRLRGRVRRLPAGPLRGPVRRSVLLRAEPRDGT